MGWEVWGGWTCAPIQSRESSEIIGFSISNPGGSTYDWPLEEKLSGRECEWEWEGDATGVWIWGGLWLWDGEWNEEDDGDEVEAVDGGLEWVVCWDGKETSEISDGEGTSMGWVGLLVEKGKEFS